MAATLFNVRWLLWCRTGPSVRCERQPGRRLTSGLAHSRIGQKLNTASPFWLYSNAQYSKTRAVCSPMLLDEASIAPPCPLAGDLWLETCGWRLVAGD